jgi:hypothetical protein
MYVGFLLENLQETYHLEALGVEDRSVLKHFIKN